MKLSEYEIRDITKYLESGKPLPEKYRFLLFEDKKKLIRKLLDVTSVSPDRWSYYQNKYDY